MTEVAERVDRRSRPAFWALLLLGYVGVSCVWWHRVLLHLNSAVLGRGLFDPGLFVWWLRWTPFAIGHGLNPLQTDYLQAPDGVSGMWNTSVAALGVLFWPVTAAMGPVASYNLALLLGPALSAWTAALWLARHAGRLPAVIGGLVFGFSPFVAAHMDGGHLNFVFLPLIPVILLLAEDLLWRSARPWWPQAPLLGLAVAVEMFISSEALLLTALTVVGLAVCLAVRYPRRALARCRVLAPAAVLAVAVGVLLCGYPLQRQFSDRFRIDGPVQPIGTFGGTSGLFVHATRVLVSSSPAHLPAVPVTAVENGMFVGWPLLAVLLLAVLVLLLVDRGRRTATVVAVIVGVVAAVSLLRPTHVLGIPVRSPLALLEEHVTSLQDAIISRAALILWAAIAWLVAVGLDAARRRLAGVSDGWGRRAVQAVPVVVVLAALVPLVPLPPTPQTLERTPAFFTSDAVDLVPQGATVMVAPMATVGNDVAQLWQIRSGMRFKLVGGYALHARGPDRLPTNYPPQRTLVSLFALNPYGLRPYPVTVTPAVLAAARAELAASGASFFVLGPSHYGYPTERARAVALLGTRPDVVSGGVEVWRLR